MSDYRARECPVCRSWRSEPTSWIDCAGTMSEPHPMTETVEVTLVRAELLEGAVDALREIAMRDRDGLPARSAVAMAAIAERALEQLGGR